MLFGDIVLGFKNTMACLNRARPLDRSQSPDDNKNDTDQPDGSVDMAPCRATSSKGQKARQVTADREHESFHMCAKLRTHFGASSFDKSVDLSRKSLDSDITTQKEPKEILQKVNQWTVDYDL